MLEFLRNHWKGMVFGAIAFAIVALSIAAVILLFPPAGALISALAATPLFAYMGAAAFGVATASVALAGALAVTSGLLVLKGIASLIGKLFNPSSQTQAEKEEYVQLFQENEINKNQDQQPSVLKPIFIPQEQQQQDNSAINGQDGATAARISTGVTQQDNSAINGQDGVGKKTSTPVSINVVGMFNKQNPPIQEEEEEEEQHDKIPQQKAQ